MRALLDAGLLHGDCLTVTGKTVAENLADLDSPDADGEILRAMSAPMDASGGITILGGSLLPQKGGLQERRGACAAVRRSRPSVRA